MCLSNCLWPTICTISYSRNNPTHKNETSLIGPAGHKLCTFLATIDMSEHVQNVLVQASENNIQLVNMIYPGKVKLCLNKTAFKGILGVRECNDIIFK